MYKYLVYILVLGSLSSCAWQHTNTKTAAQNEYDFEASILHPEYYVYHFSEDSTRVYHRIANSELLFARSSGDAPFYSSITVHWELIGGENNAILDSSTVEIKSKNESDNQEFNSGFIEIPVEAGNTYTLLIELKDLNRNTGHRDFIKLNKSNSSNRQNFLVWNPETDSPLFGYVRKGSGELQISNDRRGPYDLRYHIIDDDIKFPPPSFSDRRPVDPVVPESSVSEIDLFEEGKHYFITSGIEAEEGVCISIRNEFFPYIQTAKDMAECTRYVSTKSEYEDLTAGYDPKTKLDHFWLDCGGSQNRAKQLIRIYYKRVESANHYFSTIRPGWKTDRGLILIVYGKPNRVQKYSDSEVWIYGEEGNINSLTFVFRKKDSPFSDNHYVLDRQGDYKKSWELAVTSWRNGRIYSN